MWQHDEVVALGRVSWHPPPTAVVDLSVADGNIGNNRAVDRPEVVEPGTRFGELVPGSDRVWIGATAM